MKGRPRARPWYRRQWYRSCFAGYGAKKAPHGHRRGSGRRRRRIWGACSWFRMPAWRRPRQPTPSACCSMSSPSAACSQAAPSRYGPCRAPLAWERGSGSHCPSSPAPFCPSCSSGKPEDAIPRLLCLPPRASPAARATSWRSASSPRPAPRPRPGALPQPRGSSSPRRASSSGTPWPPPRARYSALGSGSLPPPRRHPRSWLCPVPASS